MSEAERAMAQAWDREVSMWEGIVRTQLPDGAPVEVVRRLALTIALTLSCEEEERQIVARLVAAGRG